MIYKLNVREYRKGNQKLTMKGNCQQDEEKQFKSTTKYMLGTTMNHYTHINTNNVNKI